MFPEPVPIFPWLAETGKKLDMKNHIWLLNNFGIILPTPRLDQVSGSYGNYPF